MILKIEPVTSCTACARSFGNLPGYDEEFGENLNILSAHNFCPRVQNHAHINRRQKYSIFVLKTREMKVLFFRLKMQVN